MHDPRAGSRLSALSAAERSRSSMMIPRSEEHTSELQSQSNLVCRLLLEKKKNRECTPPRPRGPALAPVDPRLPDAADGRLERGPDVPARLDPPERPTAGRTTRDHIQLRT